MAKLNKTQLKALNTQNITQNGPSDSITASEIREFNEAVLDSYVHLDELKTTYEAYPNTNAFTDYDKARIASSLQPGEVDADDINDSTTTNKFVTSTDKGKIASAIQPGDLATVATTGDYDDLINTPTSAEIATSYESNADTNKYTDAEKVIVNNTSGVNTGDQNMEPTNGGAFTGVLSMANFFGTYFSDYTLATSGTITFSIGGSATLFGTDYMQVISDGTTPFATQVNIDAIFDHQYGVPVDYILDAGTYEFYMMKNPTGATISIPALT